jgi:hypothetical protein
MELGDSSITWRMPVDAGNETPKEAQHDAELQRCEELWFDDGNVVLEAEGIGFRVYRGYLARNSSVFADMFSIPLPHPETPKEGQDTIEGCALIQMNDSAEHLRYFLLAMNDSTCGPFT